MLSIDTMIHVTRRSLSLTSFFWREQWSRVSVTVAPWGISKVHCIIHPYSCNWSVSWDLFFQQCSAYCNHWTTWHWCFSRYVMYFGDVSFAQRRCSHWAAVWKVLKPKAWTQGPWGCLDAKLGFSFWNPLNIPKQPKIGWGWIWFEHSCLGVWIVKTGSSND